mmetsp:Transcript_16114/g.30972  ORF Transcript_16114/g.30972 Transcript_16114/m.30972 type:complete len:222 (-) Transcript_16114:826-1491(-)
MSHVNNTTHKTSNFAVEAFVYTNSTLQDLLWLRIEEQIVPKYCTTLAVDTPGRSLHHCFGPDASNKFRRVNLTVYTGVFLVPKVFRQLPKRDFSGLASPAPFDSAAEPLLATSWLSISAAALISHKRTLQSAPPLASRFPPPLYSRLHTGPLCPVSVPKRLFDPRSHTITVPSSLPDAMVRPSGDIAREYTVLWCPVYRRTPSPVCTSQSLTVLSEDPVAR